jgi:hypothetical protein
MCICWRLSVSSRVDRATSKRLILMLLAYGPLDEVAVTIEETLNERVPPI